jgi:hypothetical protein
VAKDDLRHLTLTIQLKKYYKFNYRIIYLQPNEKKLSIFLA